MNRKTFLWVPVTRSLAALACGPAATPTPAISSGSEALPPTPALAQETAAPAPSDTGGGQGIVACKLVTPQEVADLIGGPIFRELEQEPSSTCIYEIAAEPDDYAQFVVSIQPPEMAEASIAAIPEELGAPIEGMGDDAAR